MAPRTKIIIVTAAFAVTVFLVSVLGNKAFAAVTKKMLLRGTDSYGSGDYGASRDNGTRTHNGIDIVTVPGEAVYSPIKGKVTRVAYPYANDTVLKGLEIANSEYTVKIFYMVPTIAIGSTIKAGTKIGDAQSLQNKYPGITNHVHLEIRQNGSLINPKTVY